MLEIEIAVGGGYLCEAHGWSGIAGHLHEEQTMFGGGHT